MTYKVVRSGVDTLELSFKGYLSAAQVSQLEAARQTARENRAATVVEMAPGLVFHVGEGGLKGGYTYTCDTGPDGEIWWFKSSQRLDWNIRVKVKAANLAARGWHGAKAKLYDTLMMLGVEAVEESIGRVDFALDCTAPDDFRIDPFLMITPATSTKKENGINLEQMGSFMVYTRARVTESVTIGKMPGRQLIIYDKSQEIKDNGKAYWWQFLGVEPETKVYRIECRFGKKFLKEKCGLSTWADLEKHLPGMVTDMLGDIRMCDRSTTGDSNAARWKPHKLWIAAAKYMHDTFDDAWMGRPARVITGERERIAGIFKQQLRGSMVSFAQVAGVSPEEFKRFLSDVAGDVGEWSASNRQEFLKKCRKAADKYRFVTAEVDDAA